MTKTDETVSFSSREMEVLALAWQCFESEPKINIAKLARLAGYTEGSAGVTMGKIKRKLKTHAAGMGEGDASTTSSTPKKLGTTRTPKSGGKRNVTSDFDESPSKKKPSGNKMLPDAREHHDDDEFKVKIEEADGVMDGTHEYHNKFSYGGYDTYQSRDNDAF